MDDFLTALGLVLVLEGIIYALFPDGMQRFMAMMQDVSPASLRAAGLMSAAVGVAIVWAIRS